MFLMMIVNRQGEEVAPLLRICREAILRGADLVQYRDKGGRVEEVISIGRELAALCRRSRVPLILNDYAELVEPVGADGVHLGQSDLSISEARALLGSRSIIGATAATPEEAVRAEREGADYIGSGHVFATSTKEKLTPPIGLEGVRGVAAAVQIPVLAIGGLQFGHARQVEEVGAAGMAICSAFIDSLQRYERQALQIGWEGQWRLSRARVLVVGCGGLGCPLLQYLVSAGVGSIGIVDGDKVEWSNLPRQPLFTPEDVGRCKAERGAAMLRRLNPEVDIASYCEDLTEENCDRISSGYEIVVDATDRPDSRYLISALCARSGKAHVYGAVEGWRGQFSVFNLLDSEGLTTRYSSLFQSAAVRHCRCDDRGVIPMVPGWIGIAMALEVMKLILSNKSPAQDHLISVELTSYEQRMYSLPKVRPQTHTDDPFHMVPSLSTVPTIALTELAALLGSNSPPLMIDVRERSEPVEGHIGGLWVPMQELFHSPPPLTEERTVVVYCRTGKRSLLAARFLLDRYPKVDIRSLDGNPQGIS
jgi:sulfur-carrier protein adenylyltransferase/sulfurtransferase